MQQTIAAGAPWAGIYITSSFRQDTSKLATLDAIFAQFQTRTNFFNLIFVFFEPGDLTDPSVIGKRLDSMAWGLPMNSGNLIWLTSSATALTQATVSTAPALTFGPYPNGGRVMSSSQTLSQPDSQPLLTVASIGGSPLSLFMRSSNGLPIQITSTTAGDGLVLGVTDGSNVQLATGSGRADAASIVANAGNVTISLSNTKTGLLTAQSTLASGVSRVGVGFEIGFQTPDPAKNGSLLYPLLDTVDALDQRPCDISLALLAPLDSTRSYVSLGRGSPAMAPVRSAYRTVLDHCVLLDPLADASSRLIFNRGYGGSVYLVPSGAFTLSIDDGDEPTGASLGNQLLCGLSGVEYIHFATGDLIQFTPDQNATVVVDIDPDLPVSAGVTFRFSGPQDDIPALAAVTTSRALILPGSATQPDVRAYYSEPDQSPFFATDPASKDPLQLSYYALSQLSLPDTAGTAAAPYCFPLLPYAALVPASSGLGADAAIVQLMELQLINPTRKAALEQWQAAGAAQSHTGQGTGTVVAFTPEGHVANFTNGAWQSLRIAGSGPNDSLIKIRFDAPASSGGAQSAALPQALQDAFLTNQQFIVMTQPDNLGVFAPSIVMDGWPFTIDLSKNTTVGDYRNVLLFKSAAGTVRQLARHPELWTRYADFNDSKGDPLGNYLSNWLVTYLDEATALYDNGNGVVSLGPFCALIDDPDWNGFLALKVDITVQNLDEQIKALLAGIDPSLFVAHHIGNQVNHIAPGDDGSLSDCALNSSMFGVVHYVDPVLGQQVNALPSYIPSAAPYDFKVLTLEAVFENARLVNFSNKSLLTLNSLFGDTVLSNGPGGLPGANTLVLLGSYKKTNVPAYTFATADRAVSDFYLNSNALDRIEITRAAMSVLENGTSGYEAKFTLSGLLRLRDCSAAEEAEQFDLLSYEEIGFSNLAVDMLFDSTGANKTFTFDPSGFRLATLPNVPYQPPGSGSTSLPPAGCNLVRADSLLAQFPLQLTGFVTGRSTQSPSALGYTTLATTVPAGISPPDLSGNAWYALAFTINLGSLGALGNNAALTAELLLAWVPGGGGVVPDVMPALKINGPGGVSLSFNIEGVVKFGAADLVLNRASSDGGTTYQFVMMLESIGFSVLGLSFPPAGTTNIMLFGDPTAPPPGQPIKPTLGWFGGYVQNPAPTN